MNSKKKPMATPKKLTSPPAASSDFDSLVYSIVHIHQQTQEFAAKAVNMALTPPKRETLSPESQIVEPLTPQLIHRLSFSHLTELTDLPSIAEIEAELSGELKKSHARCAQDAKTQRGNS